jgi:hypothetical protein
MASGGPSAIDEQVIKSSLANEAKDSCVLAVLWPETARFPKTVLCFDFPASFDHHDVVKRRMFFGATL